MVAETSDSMPTASITTCCRSSCCFYLSRCNVTWAPQQMAGNAVLVMPHIRGVVRGGGGRGVMWEFHAQVTAIRLHISKQSFLLFFSVWSLLLLLLLSFYKTPLQLVWVFMSSISISALQSFLSFSFLWKSALMRFLVLVLVCCSWYFAWLGLKLCLFFFLFAIYIFSCLDCFDGIKHSFASMQLNAFQHGKLSTTVNSIHFPLHPSCLLFLPVTVSIIGFRCQLYCENFAKCICESENRIPIWDMTMKLGKRDILSAF